MLVCMAFTLPVIPCQGSVGASGDLAPLAHMALLLVGEGEAWDGASALPPGGTIIPGGAALAKAGLAPVLVLINDHEFTKTANCWGVDNNSKGTNTNRVVFCKP